MKQQNLTVNFCKRHDIGFQDEFSLSFYLKPSRRQRVRNSRARDAFDESIFDFPGGQREHRKKSPTAGFLVFSTIPRKLILYRIEKSHPRIPQS